MNINKSYRLQLVLLLLVINTASFSSDNSLLWNRLNQGLSLNTDHQRVDVELAWFKRNPSYMTRVTQRADPYLYFVLKEVEKRNLPTELALLPIVESAYYPFAYSPGRAAGLWQFIPSTARVVGLKIDWWYDGRRDVYASTLAALDYLTMLHKRLGKDWLLALASYNAGEGNVRKAIRRNRKKGKPTDFWSLPLPRETKGYVPRLLAIAKLMKNPTQYGQKLHPIKNQSFFRRTTIDGQIDLAMAAKLADIDIEMLYQLNPAFNQWATHPDGPHYLLLPKTKVTQFQKKLAKTPAKQRLRWKRHTIKDGETLSHIAKRYLTTISVIRKVNRLPAKKSIRSGKHLMIPVAQKKPAHYSLSSTSRHKKRLQQSGKGHKILYTIRRGDTLWDIAQQYRVKTRQLERWNALSAKNLIRPGNTLIIWTNPKKTPNPLTQKTVYKVKLGDTLWDIANSYQIDISDLLSENKLNKDSILRPKQDLNIPANYQVSQEKPSNKQQYDYTVHTGDTLWEIAKKYHISIQDIRRWNHLSRKSILLTGQTLTLWLSDNNSPHINTVTESIIHYLPTPVSPMQQNMIRKITYTVRRGDSLARISDKFNVSIGKIKKWNPSTQKRTLQPGQKLKLRVDITQMPENI